MLAPPRGFSQLAASFVGYQHQGIPRVPFLPFPRFSPSSFPYSPVNVHEARHANGGDERIRTVDFLRARQALSH